MVGCIRKGEKAVVGLGGVGWDARLLDALSAPPWPPPCPQCGVRAGCSEVAAGLPALHLSRVLAYSILEHGSSTGLLHTPGTVDDENAC